jgi:hypothetical protein
MMGFMMMVFPIRALRRKSAAIVYRDIAERRFVSQTGIANLTRTSSKSKIKVFFGSDW